MIIRMTKQANILMVEHVATTFQKRGFDVHIKNGQGSFVIAVLGPGSDQIDFLTTRSLAGIDKIEKSNDLFNSRHQEFLEAWEFFRSREK